MRNTQELTEGIDCRRTKMYPYPLSWQVAHPAALPLVSRTISRYLCLCLSISHVLSPSLDVSRCRSLYPSQPHTRPRPHALNLSLAPRPSLVLVRRASAVLVVGHFEDPHRELLHKLLRVLRRVR